MGATELQPAALEQAWQRLAGGRSGDNRLPNFALSYSRFAASRRETHRISPPSWRPFSGCSVFSPALWGALMATCGPQTSSSVSPRNGAVIGPTFRMSSATSWTTWAGLCTTHYLIPRSRRTPTLFPSNYLKESTELTSRGWASEAGVNFPGRAGVATGLGWLGKTSLSPLFPGHIWQQILANAFRFY